MKDNSEGAKGSIDQAYKNTGYAIRVYTGKLTVNSGTICNTSSTGTGRWAMSITGAEGKAAAKVNINGGHIFGGRGIYIGSGTASERVFIYNAYCNNKTEKNSIFSKSGVSAHDLDPVVTYDGREYNYKICK